MMVSRASIEGVAVIVIVVVSVSDRQSASAKVSKHLDGNVQLVLQRTADASMTEERSFEFSETYEAGLERFEGRATRDVVLEAHHPT